MLDADRNELGNGQEPASSAAGPSEDCCMPDADNNESGNGQVCKFKSPRTLLEENGWLIHNDNERWIEMEDPEDQEVKNIAVFLLDKSNGGDLIVLARSSNPLHEDYYRAFLLPKKLYKWAILKLESLS